MVEQNAVNIKDPGSSPGLGEMGNGTAWGGHLICNQNSSRVQISDYPKCRCYRSGRTGQISNLDQQWHRRFKSCHLLI